jgi:uncharacterized protein YcbX
MATVMRFNTTIVKSTALDHPGAVTITGRGIEGDRRYLFVHADGTRLSGAEKAPLLGLRARFEPPDGCLSFTFLDGSTVMGQPVIDGRPFAVALYDRSVFAQRAHHPVEKDLSEIAGMDLMLVRVQPPNHAGGGRPITLISLPTVEDLGRRGGVTDAPDPRRFRMSIELGHCEPYEEDTWADRRVAIGEAVLRVAHAVPRCVLTTMDPDTGEKDFPTLDVLAGYRRRGAELTLGVYADVERGGTVRVGEAVRTLD